MIIHVALQAFTDHVSWRWYVILFYPTYSLAADTSLGVSGSTCTWSRLQPYVNYRPTCITSPTGGVALGFLFFTLHLNPPKHNKTFRQHVSEFDFLGLFLIVSGVICVLIGFNQSENSCKKVILGCCCAVVDDCNPGDSPATIALLVIGGSLLLGAAFWESYTTRSPIIPPRLFRVRSRLLYATSTVQFVCRLGQLVSSFSRYSSMDLPSSLVCLLPYS